MVSDHDPFTRQSRQAVRRADPVVPHALLLLIVLLPHEMLLLLLLVSDKVELLTVVRQTEPAEVVLLGVLGWFRRCWRS